MKKPVDPVLMAYAKEIDPEMDPVMVC